MEMMIFCEWIEHSHSHSDSHSKTHTLNLFEASIDSLVPSSFYSYSIPDLSLLSIESLSEIVSNESLVVESEDWLLDLILALGRSYYSLLDYVRYEFLSDQGISKFCDEIEYSYVTETIWSSLNQRLKGVLDETLRLRRFHIRQVPFDSTISNEYPSILSQFQDKQKTLLYRGSRDGFQSSSFHSRCDGKPFTITIIETTKGFIFGGYTPIAWSSIGSYASDDSLTSFIFTLKNGHNTIPMQFPLKSDCKQCAIRCGADRGPTFGGGFDFYVDFSSKTYTNFGHSYDNTTGYDGRTFFAGEYNFTVKEVEVFGLTE
jgi:hypothetical protein